MKQVRCKLLIFLLLTTCINVYAQEKDLKKLYTDFTTAINSVLLTKQGVIELSGFVSYNYLNTEYKDGPEVTRTISQFEPQFSYFVADNLALGLIVSQVNDITEFKSPSGKTTRKQSLIGPLAKMYFGDEKWRPFIFGDYLFASGDQDGGEIDLGAGIFYHVGGTFGMNLFGKYGIISSNQDDIEQQRRFFVGLGLSGFIL